MGGAFSVRFFQEQQQPRGEPKGIVIFRAIIARQLGFPGSVRSFAGQLLRRKITMPFSRLTRCRGRFGWGAERSGASDWAWAWAREKHFPPPAEPPDAVGHGGAGERSAARRPPYRAAKTRARTPHRVRGGGASSPESGDGCRKRRRCERQGGGRTRRAAATERGFRTQTGEAAARRFTSGRVGGVPSCATISSPEIARRRSWKAGTRARRGGRCCSFRGLFSLPSRWLGLCRG